MALSAAWWETRVVRERNRSAFGMVPPTTTGALVGSGIVRLGRNRYESRAESSTRRPALL